MYRVIKISEGLKVRQNTLEDRGAPLRLGDSESGRDMLRAGIKAASQETGSTAF